MLRLFVLILILSISPQSAFAQDDPARNGAKESRAYDLTEGGKAYLQALRGSGVEADMTYFDPTQPAPELKLDQPLEKPEEDTADGFDVEVGDADLAQILIPLLILGVVIWLFVQFGGAVTLSLRDPADEAIGPNGDAPSRTLLGGEMLSLEQVAAIDDRRIALMALLSLVLRKAADDSDMAIERSWTAREAARRLPETWPHRAPLADLIREVELTYFGGRPTDETVFQSQLQASRRILRGAAS